MLCDPLHKLRIYEYSEILIRWELVQSIFRNEDCENSMTSWDRDLGSCDIEADHVLVWFFYRNERMQ